MPHMMEFAAWLWSIGECAENAHLYLPDHHYVHICDVRSEMMRWDRMFTRDFRKNKLLRLDQETEDFV